MNNHQPVGSSQTERGTTERIDPLQSRKSKERAGMLKVSGATEGFHRSKVTSPSSNAQSRSRSLDTTKGSESDSDVANAAPSETLSSSKALNQEAKNEISAPTALSSGDAVQPHIIDRAEVHLPKIASTGYHMPPEVLGQESPTQNETTQENRRSSALANVNSRARKRCKKAVKATKSQAAVAAAARAASSRSQIAKHVLNSSMFTLLVYRGMEVMFACVSPRLVAGVCSRTHFLFQTLDLASDTSIVSISSNSHSGMLVIAHEDGIIQTYIPIATTCHDKKEVKQNDHSHQTFGRFRWINGCLIHAGQFFYQPHETVEFCDRRNAEPGRLVDISSSADQKLLVAHRNQLAVFEASDPELAHGSKQDGYSSTAEHAALLWTSMLPSSIVSAKMSGDGQALVVVLDKPGKDGVHGASTFIHDAEDGSDPVGRPPLERSASTGMVFKPGPILKHEASVTRISFRGLGHVTSSTREGDRNGNDLLLTYCREDSSVRIFNQNNWQQLMFWVAPPNSRADWIQGSSAFTLGDLESQKKTKNSGSKAPSRRPSTGSATDSSVGGGINGNLQNIRSLGAGNPTTAAGAWIAELTFRNAFPALRLSRLSYMKRGNDDSQPAHFESVAAILPAGSITAASVLNADDMGLVIQGVWPAWNPWLSETAGADNNDTLRGSAMQFLGLSSLPTTTGAHFGDSYLGGTHSPPIELRIAASHTTTSAIVLMDFPLWGDEDFGAMELGSPVRSVLSLSNAVAFPPECGQLAGFAGSKSDCSMQYESSRLCAKIESDGRSIELLWRKPGSMTLHGEGLSSDETHRRILEASAHRTPEVWKDLSAFSVPLVLPSLQIPKWQSSTGAEDKVANISWWPDSSYGGPPLLLAVTTKGTILIFEIPPPWCVREPIMPNYDPFNAAATGSTDDVYESVALESTSEDGEDMDSTRPEYDVVVTPHPDFGLGLRLESPMDGMPAVAGSFKKHPLNGGMLPAEKTGMIILGDEVLSVNGVLLENLTFDDIIATVRHVGAEAGPGEPLTLRFRPASNPRNRRHSAILQESFASRPQNEYPVPGSETVLGSSGVGVSPQNSKRNEEHQRRASDGVSLASLLVGSAGEGQQEFGRLIATIRDSCPIGENEQVSPLVLVLPWGHGAGAVDPDELRGAALLVVAVGNEIVFKRLEVPSGVGHEKSRCIELGKQKFPDSGAGVDNKGSSSTQIRKIVPLENSGPRRCFVVSDNFGLVTLVVLDIAEGRVSFAARRDTRRRQAPPLNVSISYHSLFHLGSDSTCHQVRAESPYLLATMREYRVGSSHTISIWSARPDPTCRVLDAEVALTDDFLDMDYHQSIVELERPHDKSELFDMRFLRTGLLDVLPSVVVFWDAEAIVYQRRASETKWVPLLRFVYSSIPGSMAPNISPSHPSGSSEMNKVPVATPKIGTKPAYAYAHLCRCIGSLLPSYDETFLIPDWHPESLLSLLCTEARGPRVVLKGQVEKILVWLANSAERASGDCAGSSFHTRSNLCVIPFGSVGGASLLVGRDNCQNTGSEESTPGRLRIGSADSERAARMMSLTTSIDSVLNAESDVELTGKSHEFRVAMSQGRESKSDDSQLMHSLKLLSSRELRVLKAIATLVAYPPDYRNLDEAGQMALTIIRLHETLKNSAKKDSSQGLLQQSGSFGRSSAYSVLVKRLPSGASDFKPRPVFPQSASAGSVAALLSSFQGVILDCIRKPGQKLDWKAARDARVPFWVRSDETLRKISEEIGQRLYRESKDILKSAIFFLIAGKKRTLTNLSAADRTDSGRKFFKFLTSFDFSSDRGRSAAEKNAFSLLRKNQYDSAAAFFLLAEPPRLKSAVETIVSKMKDIDLAFLVARLVRNGSSSASNSLGGFGSSSHTMLGFGPLLGGGGGYAGTGAVESSIGAKDTDRYADWKPKLQKEAIELLQDRGLPDSHDDPCFTAIQLLWLDRGNEATHWLSGFIGCPDGLIPTFLSQVSLPVLDTVSPISKTTFDPTVSATNSFLNFVTGPFLLNLMSASLRTRIAASLVVSESLLRRGIELPAIRSIVQNVDSSSFDDKEKKAPSCQLGIGNSGVEKVAPSIVGESESQLRSGKDDLQVSSIFDQYAPPPPARIPKMNSVLSSVHARTADAMCQGNAMSSSIFDSFDVPAASKRAHVPVVSSSVFDSFGGPPDTSNANDGNAVKPPSIFDDFDPPPPARAPTDSVASSSIFDNYAVPPSSRPHIRVVPNNGEASSIFDAFDPPKPGKPSLQPSLVSPSAAVDPSDVQPNLPERTAGPIRSPPRIWIEWRDHLLLRSGSRRLIRELASTCVRFHGELFEPVSPFAGGSCPLIPRHASQILQVHCDGEALIQELVGSVNSICDACGFDAKLLVNHAIQLLESPGNLHRVCFAVLLRLSLEEIDQAEDIVRNIAQMLINMCSAVSFFSHRVSCTGSFGASSANCGVWKAAAYFSWQLELCLWMHRGGALPLSGDVLKEAICAVRIGLLVASWNRDFECLETMIQQPPDCLMDLSVGRQLWTSLKVISSSANGEKKRNGSNSGGWEFLVDCRRAEATELLRPRATGCFIIRPHPDDHGVFTLSFKTNLVPVAGDQSSNEKDAKVPVSSNGAQKASQNAAKTVKRDDVVQHAIIRLSDSGFRCGSFGPFATLLKLLEAVSSSLPFALRFDQPPTEGVIKEEGSRPSPNAAFFRKLSLSRVDRTASHPPWDGFPLVDVRRGEGDAASGSEIRGLPSGISCQPEMEKGRLDNERKENFGYFLELLVLSEVRKQLSGVAAAKYDDLSPVGCDDEIDSVGSVSDRSVELSAEQEFAVAARMLRPLLIWCQMMEIGIVGELAPRLNEASPSATSFPVALNASETAIEISPTESSGGTDGGDSIVRRMIQPGSGVEFRTLRLGDAGESAMVVLFSKQEAVGWFLDNGVEKTEEEAVKRLRMMEKSRVIEPIDWKVLAPKSYRHANKGDDEADISGSGEAATKPIRYRLVDPWECEPLESREAETRGASLGRHRFLAFSLGKVAGSYEDAFRLMGGVHLLELWTSVRGGIALTKALASVHPPWERASGGDLQLYDGVVTEPVAYVNSIRQHLYRNSLFRRLGLPQRFMALIQVELLDLKNLTSPGGSLSLTVYSLLRLKRARSNAPLTVKARTLDSVATVPMKLGKSTGPNAPASWGTLVRFRFPLPEHTAADGRSYDGDREALFKGPPSVLQVSVYEKKFMSDSFLGGADVKLDGLVSGGQLEEWVPLRTEARGINWFARMRLTLRFELMCLSGDTESCDELAPSVGLRRIQQLSSMGGAQEDLKKSASTPDLLSYFESMVY